MIAEREPIRLSRYDRDRRCMVMLVEAQRWTVHGGVVLYVVDRLTGRPWPGGAYFAGGQHFETFFAAAQALGGRR